MWASQKGRGLKGKVKKLLDEFWILDNDQAVKIDIQNNNLFINLRDEAHRFAITHHRKARVRNSKYSELENIPGVGVKTRKLLLKSLGSVENIKKSSFNELYALINNKKKL